MEIYCYSNRVKKGFYIGQAVNMVERYEKDHYLGCHRIYNALQKYGLEGFDRWVFKVVDTKEEADQEERFWIAEMRRIHGEECVYNIADGGQGWSPENNPSKRPEVRAKISAAHKGKWSGSNNPKAKINKEIAISIRLEYKPRKMTRKMTRKMLSEKYNISISLIDRILSNKVWK